MARRTAGKGKRDAFERSERLRRQAQRQFMLAIGLKPQQALE